MNLPPSIIPGAIPISLFIPSPHLCPPPSPQSLSLCHSCLSQRNKITLVSGHFSSPPLLFSALITVKTNPAITFTLPTPASFCFECALHRRWRRGGGRSGEGGGFYSSQWRTAPPNNSVCVTERRFSHQRNTQWDTKTPASSHPCILARPPSALLPGWLSTKSG